MIYLKMILAAIFGLGITLAPFILDNGLAYVQQHGKGLCWLVAGINIFLGAGFAGAALSPGFFTGFKFYARPLVTKNAGLNPTYGLGAIIAIINILEVLFAIEP